MASYSNRHRDPLLDAATQAMIEKPRQGTDRGGGLALIGAGILVAMMIASYSPDDPNWMTATDRPVPELAGRVRRDDRRAALHGGRLGILGAGRRPDGLGSAVSCCMAGPNARSAG